MSGMSTHPPPWLDSGSDLRQRYLANLAALYRRDQELAAVVDALPFARLPRLEAAQDGQATVRVRADDGREIHVHSRYRPREEAERLVAQLGDASSPTFFVSGLGLGYHVQEFERQHDRPVLIVAEDDLALLKATLALHDLSGPIREGRLIFLTDTDNNVLHRKLSACNADLMLGLQLVVLPHTGRYHAAFHARMRRLLTDFVAFARMQLLTLFKTARITFKNIAFNLGSYLEHPGIDVLRDRARGFPAVIVAAGPSLARNIDQLAALRQRAVIIAVQTVLKLLQALGITPHFVTSLDFHEISAEFFRGLDDLRDCILVAEPKATWHVLDRFGGRKHVLHHRFHDLLLQEHAPPRGTLKPGTTVAHLAFYLAQHLGCDPIIFVGQDLAFSEGMFYMPGSPIERIWQPELNRFQTIEMKQWERIVRNRPILRQVRDICGRATYADEMLFTYAEQFKNDFAAAPQRIIQATEGGVPLPGAQTMTLRQAAEQYATRLLPADLLAVPVAADAGPLLRGACAALEQRLAELRQIRAIAHETGQLLERLEKLVERPAEFNRLLARVDELRTLICQHEQMYRLILEVSATAELRRYTADRSIGTPQRETPEVARRRLRRDREFVASFLDACECVEQVLPVALERVRERMR